MSIINHNSIIGFYISAISGFLALSLLSGCSSWTEPEGLGLRYTSLEEQNPELYEAYLASLRDYRNSEHKVFIAMFGNKSSLPSGQADHIVSLPDSVDYVILDNPDGLSETICSEMEEVRKSKGIKIMYSVSYDEISEAYGLYSDEFDESGTVMPFSDYLAAQLEYQCSLLDRYGYDGINFHYDGINPSSLGPEDKSELKSLQDVFFGKVSDMASSHHESIFFFDGTPCNVISDKIDFNVFRYVIVGCTDAKNTEALTYFVRYSMSETCPSDRYVVRVAAPSVSDATGSRGYFTSPSGEKVSAIASAASWTVVYDPAFTKAGICVEDVQNDYYNITKTYKYTREAIAAMNPSPLE